MKRSSIAVLLSGMLLVLPLGVAQTPDSAQQEKIVLLIKQLQAQQAQIVDNQAKIENELADIGETIRVARLFSARVR